MKHLLIRHAVEGGQEEKGGRKREKEKMLLLKISEELHVLPSGH